MLRVLLTLLVDLVIVGLLVLLGFVVHPLALPGMPVYAHIILALFFLAIIGAIIYSVRVPRRHKAS